MWKPVLSATLNSIAFNGSEEITLHYVSMGIKICLSVTSHQYDIRISLMTMKTITNTGKNRNFVRKVQEESVEAF